jgi:hypothetical protein
MHASKASGDVAGRESTLYPGTLISYQAFRPLRPFTGVLHPKVVPSHICCA